MYDQKLMDKACLHARSNQIKSRGRTSISRMAAIITNGKFEFIGYNQYKTHPLMYQFSKDHNKICLHAEIDAIIQTEPYEWIGQLSNFDIYIARVLKNDTPALAKPCNTCFGALTYFGIRNIFHT